MAIPVIDMSNLNGKDRKNIMAQIARACEEYGFFQLVNHGIPHPLMDRVKHVCSENFKLEREQKFLTESLPVKTLNKALVESANGSSAEPKKIDNVDWEDVFEILYDQKEYEWPSQPSEFKETMEEFGKEVTKLAETLLEILSENLGLEKNYLKKTFGGPGSQAFFGTKVSHYPPCPRPDLITGLRPHTDAGGVILLFQDDVVGGLEVLNNGKWIDVQPMINAIVIDVGDQVEAISNGKYKSAWHRILATENGNRRSVASYYNPSLDAVIGPALQLTSKAKKQDCNGNVNINGSEMPSYPNFVYADYMTVYAKQKYLPKEPRFQAMAGTYID
uniref:aminocyclopropanecarboxylate oxidase n=1 Tax=Araucaria cunninghamii TaxID=56994 RepID=A0A0D6QX66_ARACU